MGQGDQEGISKPFFSECPVAEWGREDKRGFVQAFFSERGDWRVGLRWAREDMREFGQGL
jgi:hypothetical protein